MQKGGGFRVHASFLIVVCGNAHTSGGMCTVLFRATVGRSVERFCNVSGDVCFFLPTEHAVGGVGGCQAVLSIVEVDFGTGIEYS